MSLVLHHHFDRDYFGEGKHLVARVTFENGDYYVQLGGRNYRYKKYETAFKKYDMYLFKSIVMGGLENVN